MKNQPHMNISDRRSGNERRIYETDLGFPFVDGHGQLVTEERRKVTDRRTGYGNLRTDTLEQFTLGEQTA
ncbi:MAG: hypothetical protein L0Z73_09620 [Gammaproteobacteria bacterium]|nr:hypothetical protein [Gammaproteobacteria bacterium]